MTLSRLLPLGLVLVAACCLSSCHIHARARSPGPAVVVAGPQPWVYYPNAEVYYHPASRKYYWVDGGVWKVGTRVPAGLVLGSSVKLSMQGAHPRAWHAKIKAKHPRRVKVVPGKVVVPPGHRKPKPGRGKKK